MNVVIINCSIHHENTDQTVGALLKIMANQSKKIVQAVDLDSFSSLFTGAFIDRNTANPDQSLVLQAMHDADNLVFVSPTYYKAMPGVIKNFFDIVRDKTIFADKLAMVVSSNHKNQDFGARELLTCLGAMIEYYDISMRLIPEIPIINPEAIESDACQRVIELLERYNDKL